MEDLQPSSFFSWTVCALYRGACCCTVISLLCTVSWSLYGEYGDRTKGQGEPGGGTIVIIGGVGRGTDC